MESIRILPTPRAVRFTGKAKPFVPAVTTKKEEWKAAARSFAEYCGRRFGRPLALEEGGAELVLDFGLPRGAYRVDTENGVKLYASDDAGIQYALATLMQLIEGGEVAEAIVEDAPESNFRALMVDLSRVWHPFETLLEYVDLCWLYKANYLHLHFVDSQAYTLPSRAFPKLNVPGRYYTEEQIAALCAYAGSRGVELIPEIEAPGHGNAMLEAYPGRFACTGGEGPKHDLFCAGKPGIYDDFDAIIGEVCRLFPGSRYIHIGGDEAQVQHWNGCPDCRAYMKAHGIADCKALYTRFVGNITKLVLARGRTPIVWEGFPRDGSEEIPRDVVVISWENMYNYTYDLLADGFKIVNACWQPLYIVPNRTRFTWDEREIMAWNLYNWQNWNPKSVAHLNPINVQPTGQVLGAELCAWEDSYEGDIDAIRRRLAALCERTWTVSRRLEDDEFLPALARLVSIAESIKK